MFAFIYSVVFLFSQSMVQIERQIQYIILKRITFTLKPISSTNGRLRYVYEHFVEHCSMSNMLNIVPYRLLRLISAVLFSLKIKSKLSLMCLSSYVISSTYCSDEESHNAVNFPEYTADFRYITPDVASA